MEYILEAFQVTNEEYNVLNDKFGKLAHYAAWQLIKKNSKSNHTDDPDDVAQELRLAMIRAAAYFKRQVYLEDCMKIANKYIKSKKALLQLRKLEESWDNRTKHGANKQRFGPREEAMLDKLVEKYVPLEERPNKRKTLEINSKFTTYCKSVVWNKSRSHGKGYSKDKRIRMGTVSLSEFDYLGSSDEAFYA